MTKIFYKTSTVMTSLEAISPSTEISHFKFYLIVFNNDGRLKYQLWYCQRHSQGQMPPYFRVIYIQLLKTPYGRVVHC